MILLPAKNKLRSLRTTARLKYRQIIIKLFPILVLIIVIIILTLRTIHSDDKPKIIRSKVNYKSSIDSPFTEGCTVPQNEGPRANATFVILARNNELKDVVSSMKSLERHFNQWFQYPYVFLNDAEFDDDFKNGVKNYTNANVEFGVISADIWKFPNEDTTEFKESVETQGDRGIMYGNMKSYHSMCRFYSGFFHKHELVRKYEWYWRVEPDVEFFCDITYDPFIEMEKSGKKYGFTIMIKELWETVPNLFRLTQGFLKQNEVPKKSAWKLFTEKFQDQWHYNSARGFKEKYSNFKDESDLKDRIIELLRIRKLLKFVNSQKRGLNTGDSKYNNEEIKELVKKATSTKKLPKLQGETIDGEDYNLYHFWSNFEIARVDLWDNPIYESYFQYLEESGGFYKERWGDAPVHSLAVGFMLDLKEVHYFRDIGYQHTTIAHCPVNHPLQLPYEDSSNLKINGDKKFQKHWSKGFDSSKEYGVGCRCKCPRGHVDIEDSDNDFLGGWFEMTKDDYTEPKKVNVNKLERKLRKENRL